MAKFTVPLQYLIKLDERLVGYAVAPAKSGDRTSIEYRGLAIQSEGREFIRKVKSLDTILSKLPTSYQPHCRGPLEEVPCIIRI